MTAAGDGDILPAGPGNLPPGRPGLIRGGVRGVLSRSPNSTGKRATSTGKIHGIFRRQAMVPPYKSGSLNNQCPGSDCRGIEAVNQELAFW